MSTDLSDQNLNVISPFFPNGLYIYIILLLKISVKNVRKLGLSHTRVVIATPIEQKKAKHSVPSISTLRQTPNTNTCLCSCKSPTRMFRTTLIAKFKTKTINWSSTVQGTKCDTE